jgi:hypothetical protein
MTSVIYEIRNEVDKQACEATWDNINGDVDIRIDKTMSQIGWVKSQIQSWIKENEISYI